MNRYAIIILIVSVALTAGCGKRDGAERQQAENALPETRTPPSDRVESFGGEALRGAAVTVPRRPHPPIAEIFRLDEDSGELEEADRAALMKAAGRVLVSEVPDFAVKDSGRPWLDRQYVPEEWRVSETDEGITGVVKLQVLHWDEGRAAEPSAVLLTYAWVDGEWVLEQAPPEYLQDLQDAIATLSQEWKPGERTLP